LGDLKATYLDTATTSETTDSRLGDTLDVVSKDLAMTLGSALFIISQRERFRERDGSCVYLSESFPAFASCFGTC
jgi:hypothetical protein